MPNQRSPIKEERERRKPMKRVSSLIKRFENLNQSNGNAPRISKTNNNNYGNLSKVNQQLYKDNDYKQLPNQTNFSAIVTKNQYQKEQCTNKYTVVQAQEVELKHTEEKHYFDTVEPFVNVEKTNSQLHKDETEDLNIPKPKSASTDSAFSSLNNYGETCSKSETFKLSDNGTEVFNFEINNFEKKTKYVEVNKDQEDSNKTVEKITETSWKDYSHLIKQGEPNLYLLNAKENSISSALRWFEIGHPPNNKWENVDHKVIILMGATGCGKSTLINGMVNYILGVKWNDSHRFKCVREDENESRNQAHSQTSSVTAYTIHHREGTAVPYSITLIDTPGYGDTRGVVRDKEITKTIHQFLMEKDARIDVIHAACFVAASSDSRLTITQRYIIDSVLSIFGKDFKDNIRLLVTFADNAVPPVVEACRVANFPETFPSAGIVYSKFNSSVLYASTQKEHQTEFDDICLEELYWDMGQENFKKFFTMLEEMKGKDLRSTRQVIQHRKQLEQSLKDIKNELEECFIKIENIDIFVSKIKAHRHKMETNKNFVIEKTEMKLAKVDCEEGELAFNCTICCQTCEAPSHLINSRELSRKSACSNEKCKLLEHDHSNETFFWRYVPVKVETTFDKMKFEYELNYKRKLETEELLLKCSEDLNQTKGKVIELLYKVGVTARSLDSTALRSNAITPADYLSLMRSRVAEEQAPGYQRRLETLAELQQQFSCI